MGKKGKKGKVKDPLLIATEWNEKLITGAMTSSIPTIVGVLDKKSEETELEARAKSVGVDTKEGKSILKEMELGGAHEFIDVNFKNEHQRTALMYASLQGFREVVDCLLAGKADPNLACPAGNSALHLSAHYGKHEVMRSLAAAKAAVNQVDADGETALHRAAFQGHDQATEILVELKADLYLENKDGRNATAAAEVSKNKDKGDVIQILLDAEREYQRNKRH